MKKITYYSGGILMFLCFTLSPGLKTNAQITQTPSLNQDWTKMMADPKANFYDVQKAFNAWYEEYEKNNPEVTGEEEDNEAMEEQIGLYKRWEWIKEPRVYPTGFLPGRSSVHEDQSVHRTNLSSTANWTYIGNNSVPMPLGKGGDGRVNRIRFMPYNNNIIFACTPQGGLWKSTTGGNTWSTTTDQLADLATDDIAINPYNTNIMYLASGDGEYYNNSYLRTSAGIGVLKSTDGGNTWNPTALTYILSNGVTVNELLINTSSYNASFLIAATSSGIYYTNNGGTTWGVSNTGGAQNFKSIEFAPGTPNKVYAATSGAQFFRSLDSGKTFTNITSGLPTAASADRFEIGVSPADPARVYILADSIRTASKWNPLYGLYMSTDTGKTFTKQTVLSGVNKTPNVLGYDSSGKDNGGNGWYTLALAVCPTNADSLVVGGVNIWFSGQKGIGKNWTLKAQWQGKGAPVVHADIHQLIYLPGGNSKTYFAAHDGGVSKTTNNGTSWTDISGNLQIGQQYSAGPSARTANLFLTGWQDNGVNLSNPAWSNVIGGDGMVSFIDYSNDNNMYGENFNGTWKRSTNGGGSFSRIDTQVALRADKAPWITRWMQAPQNPATLYGGRTNIWKSTNSGGTWASASVWSASTITALLVDSLRPNTVYAANQNDIQATFNGGGAWRDWVAGLPGGFITGIACNTKAPKFVWISYSGYAGSRVAYSADSGRTWTDQSGGLPNLPVNCLKFQCGSPNGVYAGTDQGVYYRDSVLKTWVKFSDKLPNVMIGDLQLSIPSKTLIAATYGRGTWQTPWFVGGPPKCYFTGLPRKFCQPGTVNLTDTSKNYPQSWFWLITGPNGFRDSSTTQNPSFNLDSTGAYTVKLVVKSGYGKDSLTKTNYVVVGTPPILRDTGSTHFLGCAFGYNGSAYVHPSGGAGPYTFYWSPYGGYSDSATGLGAGNYTVTVYDTNGCSSTATFSIVDTNTPVSLTIHGYNIPCQDSSGVAYVSVSGGRGPFTYTWYPYGGSRDTTKGLAGGYFYVYVSDSCHNTTSAYIYLFQPDSLQIYDAFVFPVLCHGDSNGYVYAYVTGGRTPYTYIWSPAVSTDEEATGLTAGTYTLVVKDSCGRSVRDTFVITQPTALMDSISLNTNLFCFGDSIGFARVAAWGGTKPYTYSWNTNPAQFDSTASHLKAQKYKVYVTDSNGCMVMDSVTLTQPAPIVITMQILQHSNCSGAGGEAFAFAVGGTPGYTFSWSNGSRIDSAHNLTEGTYTVFVNDYNGCRAKDSITITNNGTLNVNAGETDAACGFNNGTATANPLGGSPPFTYLWNSNPPQTTQTAAGLSAGNYTVTVTDSAGCVGNASTTVFRSSGINANTAQVNVTCKNLSDGAALVMPTTGQPPYTYSWSNGETSSIAVNLSAGTYRVVIKDFYDCADTVNFVITQPNVLAANASVTSPVHCNGNNSGSAQSSPVGGTSPYTYSWSSGEVTSNISGKSAGTYSITVTDSNHCDATASIQITQPPVLRDSLVSADIVNVTCNGGSNGSAIVGVKGGETPYTYSWTPLSGAKNKLTGMSAGSYSVIVSDKNGCSVTAGLTLTQPAEIKDSVVSLTNLTCYGSNNGSATIGVKGGASPLTYTWTSGVSTTTTATNLKAQSYTVTVKDKNGCSNSVSFTLTEPLSIRDSLIASSKVNVTCNGGNNGSATVGAKLGTSPYFYSWSPSGGTNSSASNLTAGNYTVSVKDMNGCTGTSIIVSITQPAILRDSMISAGTYIIKCNGGSTGGLKAGVKGGISPYTYSWAPVNATTANISNLSAGSYTVYITDKNGCPVSASITLTQPAVLNDSLVSKTSPTCNGGNNGTATIGVKGGTTPYTYTWTDNVSSKANATNLKGQSYTVTVKDKNGCSQTAGFSITQPLAMRDSIVAATKVNVSCNGGYNGRATVGTKFGTPPYTYSWTPYGGTTSTATNLYAGTYKVYVTDNNGCSGTTSLTIIQPSLLRDSIVLQTCAGGSGSATIGVKNGTRPYFYSWSPGGGTKANMTGLPNGIYTVTITDNNGCTASLSLGFLCSSNLSPDEAPLQQDSCCPEESSGDIRLYPNPNTGQFTIQWAETQNFASVNWSVEVYNVLGERVYSQFNIQNSTFNINLSNQSNGIYLVRIISKEGTLVSQKKVVKTQ